MSKTTTRKVRIVRKPTTVAGTSIPVGVPVNVKVAGESVMRKRVVLHTSDDNRVLLVRTGRRGRPSRVLVSDIERVRAL